MDEKVREMKEKYADVINDLAVKYDKDVGVAWDMFKAIARAKTYGLEPMYTTNIELDEEELRKDYMEFADLALRVATEKGIN